MRGRHVLGERGVLPPPRAAHMRGDAPALVEDLDGPACHARVDRRVDQLIRHAVKVVGDLDVIVDVHAIALPGRQFVGRGR